MIEHDRDLVLVIAQEIGEVITPIQLQKAVFLVSKQELEGLHKPRYGFRPYHYGPFAKEIYIDAEELHEQGLVFRAPSRNGPWVDTVVTPKGSQKAGELRESLPPSTIDAIREIAQTVMSMSFQELAQHIYANYPEFAKNSTIHRPT